LTHIMKDTFIGLVFGLTGTTIGGIAGVFLDKNSNKLLSFVLEFAAGFMVAIICFDLIPEAIKIINISSCILYIFSGVILMIVCNSLMDNFFNLSQTSNNTLLKAGLIISVGLGLHNFPEGLAIGAGLRHSTGLGITLGIACFLHDIPEGLAVSLPLQVGGMTKLKSLIIVILSGIATGIGAFFGVLIGNISEEFIGFSLAFAAGAMLYIISCELIPQSNKLYSSRLTTFANILGVIFGIMIQSI